MRNSPKFILMFILTGVFFICSAQAQENIVHTHQDLPQWSPDGKKYACAETGLNEGMLESQIRIYQVSGGKEIQVGEKLMGLGDKAKEVLPEGTVGDDPIVAFFSWAPDSEHYVFTSSTPFGYDLFIGDLSGNINPLTSDSEADLFPRWSPNPDEAKQYIAYMREGKIFLQKLKKEEVKFIPEWEKPREISPDWSEEALLPEWSPDGTQLAFSALTEGGNYDISLYQVDTQNYVRLTDTPDVQEYHPVWSPDGKLIAVYSQTKDAPAFGISVIKAEIGSPIREIRPSGGKSPLSLSHHGVRLVDRAHHSLILGPAWMPSSRHLVYVEPDNHAMMMVEFSPNPVPQKVDVQTWPIAGLTTQLNADVQCAPTEAKLIFSHFVHVGGGVSYRNLKLHPLKAEKREFTLQVSSEDSRWPLDKQDGIDLNIQGVAREIKTVAQGESRRSLSWKMECAVGDMIRGIVECRGYSPRTVTLPIVKEKAIEASVQLEVPEVKIEMWVVDQDNEGIKGVEVRIDNDNSPLDKTTKDGYTTGNRKLRITYPILERVQFTHQPMTSIDLTDVIIASQAELRPWGVQTFELLDSPSHPIPYQTLSAHVSDIEPDGVVNTLVLIARLQVPVIKIPRLFVRNRLNQNPIKGVEVVRTDQNSQVKVGTTDEHGSVDPVPFKALPNTPITLGFKHPGYQDFKLPSTSTTADGSIRFPGKVDVDKEGNWYVPLDSVREWAQFKVTADDGQPLDDMWVFIDGEKLGKTKNGFIGAKPNAPRPASPASLTLEYEKDPNHYQYKDQLTLNTLPQNNPKSYQVILTLPTFHLPVKVQNERGQPLDGVASLTLKGDNESRRKNALPADGTVDIQALYGKTYDLTVQIEKEQPFLDSLSPLKGTFQWSSPSDPPIITFETPEGLSPQAGTLHIQFRTGPLVSVLECVYPDGAPIRGKPVKYKKQQEVGKTDETGKIVPAFLLTREKAQHLTIGEYPLKEINIFSEEVTDLLKLMLSVPDTVLTLVVEDEKGKPIKGLPIKALGIQPRNGEEVVKYSTKNGTDFTIPRLPEYRVTFCFDYQMQAVKVEVNIKSVGKDGGDIEITSDEKHIADLKGKQLVFKLPDTWKKQSP